MEPIASYEELEQDTIDGLLQQFPGAKGMILRIGDIDISRGAGIVGKHTKCIWTHDGHRITVSGDRSGTMIGSYSPETDPLAEKENR